MENFSMGTYRLAMIPLIVRSNLMLSDYNLNRHISIYQKLSPLYFADLWDQYL